MSIHVEPFFTKLLIQGACRETREACLKEASYIHTYDDNIMFLFKMSIKNNGWFYLNWMVHALMFLHVNGVEITYHDVVFVWFPHHVVKLCWYLLSLKSHSYWFSMVDHTIGKKGYKMGFLVATYNMEEMTLFL